MKKLILLLLMFICMLRGHAQHNSDFIQYMFNGLLINPAYAGSQEALNITAMYRRQWIGLSGAPSDVILTGHSPLKNKNLNLGAVLINDQFGVYNHTNASLIYAYRFKLLTGKLSLGLQAGIDTYSTNWNKIHTTESGDPSFVPAGTRQTLPTAGAGAYYHTKNFYLGLSVPNLFNGQLNPGSLSTITSGAVFKISDDFRIKPAVLVKHVSGSPVLANISSTFYYKEFFGLGLGYTINNSALVYTDIKVNEQLNIGYGYAYMLNKLNAYTYGSHEIMIRYLFRYKINAVNARFF